MLMDQTHWKEQTLHQEPWLTTQSTLLYSTYQAWVIMQSHTSKRPWKNFYKKSVTFLTTVTCKPLMVLHAWSTICQSCCTMPSRAVLCHHHAVIIHSWQRTYIISFRFLNCWTCERNSVMARAMLTTRLIVHKLRAQTNLSS
jgi:hypothetical protein